MSLGNSMKGFTFDQRLEFNVGTDTNTNRWPKRGQSARSVSQIYTQWKLVTAYRPLGTRFGQPRFAAIAAEGIKSTFGIV